TEGGKVADHINAEKQADGSIRYILTSKFPIYDQEGKVIGLFGITRDVTEIEDKILAAKESSGEKTLSSRNKVMNFIK
ncbi:MAG: PAS domain-containing protein, partial [Bacteroidota bacterium]